MGIHFFSGSEWKDVQIANMRSGVTANKTTPISRAWVFNQGAWKKFYDEGGSITVGYAERPGHNPFYTDMHWGFRKGEFGSVDSGKFIGSVEVTSLLYTKYGDQNLQAYNGYLFQVAADVPFESISSIRVQLGSGAFTTLIPYASGFLPWDGEYTSWIFAGYAHPGWGVGQAYEFVVIQ